VGARIPASELIMRHLLPVAHNGLRDWGIDQRDIDRLLGVIDERVLSGQNGAVWQIATWKMLIEEKDLDRPQAAVELVRRYQELCQAGEPVHTWPLGT
jgi:hypothetical protein